MALAIEASSSRHLAVKDQWCLPGRSPVRHLDRIQGFAADNHSGLVVDAGNIEPGISLLWFPAELASQQLQANQLITFDRSDNYRIACNCDGGVQPVVIGHIAGGDRYPDPGIEDATVVVLVAP